MCKPVTCSICGKTTWAGCGQHVAQVERSVPAAQWCGHTPQERDAAGGSGGAKGALGRIFGR